MVLLLGAMFLSEAHEEACRLWKMCALKKSQKVQPMKVLVLPEAHRTFKIGPEFISASKLCDSMNDNRCFSLASPSSGKWMQMLYLRFFPAHTWILTWSTSCLKLILLLGERSVQCCMVFHQKGGGGREEDEERWNRWEKKTSWFQSSSYIFLFNFRGKFNTLLLLSSSLYWTLKLNDQGDEHS